MLKKRVIFTLLYDNGYFMLSRNFRLQRVGDIHWLRKNYNFSHIAFSIDELIILDVTRGERDIGKFCEHIKIITEDCFVPIAAGGGISSLDDAAMMLRSGADKVVINSALSYSEELISKVAAKFGQQAIIGAVDVKQLEDGAKYCFINNGVEQQELSAKEYIDKITKLPIGELYLNSMDRDGTGQGYDLDLLDFIEEHHDFPLILAGGAGKPAHFAEGLKHPKVDAVATAHLFNFVGNGLEKARRHLLSEDFELPCWDLDVLPRLKSYHQQD